LKQSDSLTGLIQKLVQTPSQAGFDKPSNIVNVLKDWFQTHGVEGETLQNEEGGTVAFCAVTSGSGPLYLLNACIDTAPIGNRASWTHDPFGADIDDGWLYGRGSGDSKAGASVFSHLFFMLKDKPLSGRLAVLFDADEHTGAFGGIKAFMKKYPETSAACIGYPGQDELVIGARGFFRGKITLFGTAGHTGMPGGQKDNALMKAASFIQIMNKKWQALNPATDPAFPFGPSLTFTTFHAGSAYAIVPDTAEITFDMRLTTAFTGLHGEAFLADVLRAFPHAVFEGEESWPAYTLSKESPFVTILLSSIRETLGHDVTPLYCGPSNIGNYLSSLGISATCGFGVICENYHAIDERIRIDSLEPVLKAYHTAFSRFLQ